VRNGLEVIEGSNGIVAVHDAVRPLVSEGTIERSFNAALAFGAAVPVMPVVDSVRVVNGTENHPVDRTRYRLVQTPQCFEINLLRDAYNQDFRLTFTDDASVVEAFGHPVQLVEGNRENIKLTTPVDMIIAESLLRS
jgi:2-C-methyl-D-erythritol 4-phosphate cytidylyltransferase